MAGNTRALRQREGIFDTKRLRISLFVLAAAASFAPAAQVAAFTESQSDDRVVASRKGNYSEALNAGIAAFRARKHPHILEVFEVGTATTMAARAAILPVQEVMSDSGLRFDPQACIPSVTGSCTDTEGNMLSFPRKASTPVMDVNRTMLEEAGVSRPFTTAWQSRMHLESFSAHHDAPFATRSNGFEGTDTELVFNGPLQVAPIDTMGRCAQDGRFIYAGRRNDSGANVRARQGGQRQRVAMGRAIVRDPAVFLFDRPLSNLDAKLRVQMRLEIKALQRKLGMTSLYVTHDQWRR